MRIAPSSACDGARQQNSPVRWLPRGHTAARLLEGKGAIMPGMRPIRPVPRRFRNGPPSTCAFAVLKQERDLHDDLELGHLIILDDGLELLGPDGADVADRARGALDRLTNCVLEALRGSA